MMTSCLSSNALDARPMSDRESLQKKLSICFSIKAYIAG